MDSTKLFQLGALAILLMVFGGSVAAVSIASVKKIDTRMITPNSNAQDTDTMSQREVMKSARVTLVDAIKTSLADNKEAIDAFKETVKKVRSNIVNDTESDDAGNGNGIGTSVYRIVMATELTAEQKAQLLRGLIDAKHSKGYARHNMVMWSMSNDFLAIAKIGGQEVNGKMAGIAIGYNSEYQQRFKLFMGNGFIAGFQKGDIFWGTYTSDGSFTLTGFDGENRIVKGKFAVYD